MKKILFLITLCSLISNANAGWLVEIESALLESDMLDQQYKFKDYQVASELFRDMNNKFALSLPVMINKDVEIINALFTPYSANVSYKIHSTFTKDEADAYNTWIYSSSFLDGHCKDIYETEFFEVNDYSLNFTILDLDEHRISEIKVNHGICDLYNANLNDIIDW